MGLTATTIKIFKKRCCQLHFPFNIIIKHKFKKFHIFKIISWGRVLLSQIKNSIAYQYKSLFHPRWWLLKKSIAIYWQELQIKSRVTKKSDKIPSFSQITRDSPPERRRTNLRQSINNKSQFEFPRMVMCS